MSNSLELKTAVLEWVRKACEVCGSQKELSRRAEISYRTVQKYYDGSSTPGGLSLLKISQVTGLSLDAITGVAGETAKRIETYTVPELSPGTVPLKYALEATQKIQDWCRKKGGTIEDDAFRLELLEMWATELYKDDLAAMKAGLDHAPDKPTPVWLELVRQR